MATINEESILLEGVNGSNGFDGLSQDLKALLASVTENLEGVSFTGDGVILKNEVVARLSEKQLERLNLPKQFPYRLRIETSGSPATKAFEVKYLVVDKFGSSKPVTDVKGITINIGSDTYTVNEPYFSFFNIINAINKNTLNSIEERLEAVGKLIEEMPEDIITGNDRIKDFVVVKADRFTLDVLNPEEFDIVPELIDSKNKSTLSSVLSKEFKESFKKRKRGVQHFVKCGNTYIKPTANLVKALEVVKQVSSEPIEERRAFYINPMEKLKNYLSEEMNEEAIDDLFLENESYTSQRIKHLGVWVPKVGVFLPPTGSSWFSEDKVYIKMGDKCCLIDVEKIEDLLKEMEAAHKDGKNELEYDGERIPVTAESIETISGLVEFTEEEPEEDDNNKKKSPKTKRIEKIVAIIKDNIDEDEFEKEKKAPLKYLKKYIPDGLRVSELYPHQEKGISWLQECFINRKPGALLADDMGLGKTLQVLVFLKWITEQVNPETLPKKPILIVAPSGLLKNWKEEHDKMLASPGLGGALKAYGVDFRRLRKESDLYVKQKMEDSDWVLTTYETLRDQEQHFRKISWQVIVFDEIQKIKSPQARMTDMAKAMDSVFSIGLTGTPVENRLQDLWCVSDCLHPKFLDTLKNFSDKYEKNKNPDLDELTSKVQKENPPSFMLRRVKENELKGLPKKEEVKRDEVMPERQLNTYNQVLAEAQTGTQTKGDALNYLHRIRRVSFFLEENVDEIDEDYIKSCAKLKVTVDILDEIKSKNEKVLIFLENRKLQQLLSGFFVKKYNINPIIINGSLAGDRRQDRKHEFERRSDGFDIMLIAPRAGGVGLNITGANHVIHLERWWNPAVEDQCTCRSYRIGQEKDVKVYYPRAIHPSIKAFDIVFDEKMERKRKLSREVICVSDFSDRDSEELYNRVFKKDVPLENERDDDFYNSPEWKERRRQYFQEHKKECLRCGSKKNIHLDHIKPRSKFPELALEYSNLQALCSDCNLEKGTQYGEEWDFRHK